MIKRLCDICEREIKAADNYYIFRITPATPSITPKYDTLATMNSCSLRPPENINDKEVCVNCYNNIMNRINERKDR